MNIIGETITNLRKKHGMTQEQLARNIGVSAQSVSKWENGTNMPDIMLLPIIADIFGVSVDYLFGRGNVNGGNSINPDKCLEMSCDAIMEKLALSCFNANTIESSDEFLKKYRSAIKNDQNLNSAVFRNHGSVFYNDRLGGLAIKRPDAGWSSLFDDESAEAIKLFADDDFRKVFCGLVKSGMKTFTLSSVCKLTGIDETAEIAEKLDRSRMFTKSSIDVDGSVIDIYEFTGYIRFFITAIYALAKAYTEYEDKYYCLHGDIDAFTD